MKQKKLRVAPLIRVSTEKQASQGESLRTQRQQISHAHFSRDGVARNNRVSIDRSQRRIIRQDWGRHEERQYNKIAPTSHVRSPQEEK